MESYAENNHRKPVPVHITHKPVIAATASEDIDLSQISNQISLILRRTSQLYNLFHYQYDTPSFKVTSIKHINAVYAISKNLLEQIKLYQNPDNINNLNFLKFIHQCVLYDFLYDEMSRNIGYEPNYYKRYAINHLTREVLNDILHSALAECGYVANQMEIKHYMDLFLYNPPWDNLQDDNKLAYEAYVKIKPFYYHLFNIKE